MDDLQVEYVRRCRVCLVRKPVVKFNKHGQYRVLVCDPCRRSASGIGMPGIGLCRAIVVTPLGQETLARLHAEERRAVA